MEIRREDRSRVEEETPENGEGAARERRRNSLVVGGAGSLRIYAVSPKKILEMAIGHRLAIHRTREREIR